MRTLLTALAATWLVGIAAVGAATPAAAADDGNLRMEADVTYELQPDAERVHVTVEMRLTNLVADYIRSDGATVYTVYESVSVPVPAEATNIVAGRVGGGSLATFGDEMDDPRWTVLGVDLSPDLRYGSPQTIELSYDLPDQPPRSDGLVRASPAYTLFPIYPMGDPEHATITVRVPDAFEQLEVVGSYMRRSVADGFITYSNDGVEEDFYATLAARNDELLAEREISSGSHTFVLRYTPGDEEWADFAEDVVSRGVGLLEQAIGEPWPGDADMAIIESSSPHAYGYAGWFDSEANAIEVGDQLDSFTMLHELAHAWFNHDTMSERWLREGLADLYADRAAHRMKGFTPQVDAGPSDADETVVLSDWDDSSVGARPIDEYGYETSWWAMDRIYADIGAEAMTAVLAAAFDRKIPYASADGDREELRGPVDWRRMLDLLEEAGGSEAALTVYEELVLDADDMDRVAERDEARAVYDDLLHRADGWGAPYELRQTMATWSFTRVDDLVAESDRILTVRDDVLAALAALGVDELPALADEYQASERLDETIELSRQYADTTELIEVAQQRPDGVAGALTAIGTTIVPTEHAVTDAAVLVAGGELDEARTVSQAIIDHVDDAPMFGGIVLGQVVLCLSLVPFIVRARLRGQRGEPPAPDQESAEVTGAPAGSVG